VTFREGINADTRHAVRNNDNCEAVAIMEGTNTNARYAVRDINGREVVATSECTITDARHTIGNSYSREAGATIEGRLADARHAVGNHHILHLLPTYIKMTGKKERIGITATKRNITQALYAGKLRLGETITTFEGRFTNARHTVAYSDRLEA